MWDIEGTMSHISGTTYRAASLIATLTVLSVGVTGCQQSATNATSTSASSKAGSPTSTAPASNTAAGPVTLRVSIPTGAKNVAPTTALTVTPTNGQIVSVAVLDAKGAPLEGTVGADGAWVLSGRLVPKTSYTVTAVAQGGDGTKVTETSAFTTVTPKITATYRVWPAQGTVGVGMPVTVMFDSPVADQYRATVEKAMQITVTPAQEGSWGWSQSNALYWRPKTYWLPGTTVSVKAPLAGVQTGTGKFAMVDKQGGFTVGSARISTVNLKTHRMVVKENGKVVADYPVSGGRLGPKTTTRSGIKVITSKSQRYVMDSASYGVMPGDPAYYRQEVQYAMRITNTGEFLHAAPWSVWAQGRQNVSHGCVNMGPSAARQMYNASKIGDVVIVTGTNRQFKPGEGLDAWLYSWDAWKARSTAPAPAAG